jgi:LIVCS family branched-chain amino acid:cation transporter
MKSKGLILSTGLAMFSMFFGSGNLVFPIVVGQMSQGHHAIAALGILLTGVVVPFLGILAILLFNGSSHDFFARLGKPATFWFPLLALSLMGPFGVLARCITVAHGAFKLIIPTAHLWIFSGIACLLIFALTIRRNQVVSLLGSILTPILVASLGLIAYFALTSQSLPNEAGGALSSFDGFSLGIVQGYQTMDLLAAFFFSSFVIKHLQSHKSLENNMEASLPIFLKSALVGASLLSLIYCFLVLMGAMYAPELALIPEEEMMGYIAQKTLGVWAGPVVCIAIILACLTTAIVLAALFADFLRKEVAHKKISPALSLAVTLTIAFATSTLGFSGIAKIIGPILTVSYPALIVLTVVSICQKLSGQMWGWKMARLPAAFALFAKLVSEIVGKI